MANAREHLTAGLIPHPQRGDVLLITVILDADPEWERIGSLVRR